MESLKKWISADDRAVEIVGGSEMIGKSVSLLRRKTIEDKGELHYGECQSGEKEGEEEEEEGVSVLEKNGILGIVLEVVEGGGWKGSYEELEEVVGRLEEEGERGWRERRGKKREGGGRVNNGGIEWREMGRLSREIGWAIEKRKREKEGKEGEGEIITLDGMKKNLADEKKGREESERRAEEERRKREESEREREEEKRGREEEKRKREESEKKADEEKRMMEERIRNLEQEVAEMNRLKEEMLPIIKSLSKFNLDFSDPSKIAVNDNTITQVGSGGYQTCVFRNVLESVCIHANYRLIIMITSENTPLVCHHSTNVLYIHFSTFTISQPHNWYCMIHHLS